MGPGTASLPSDFLLCSWGEFLHLGRTAGQEELQVRGFPIITATDSVLCCEGQTGGSGRQPACCDLLHQVLCTLYHSAAMDCYSGTTANPKGAMLSQDNVTWTCASAAETYGMVEGKEEVRAT